MGRGHLTDVEPAQRAGRRALGAAGTARERPRGRKEFGMTKKVAGGDARVGSRHLAQGEGGKAGRPSTCGFLSSELIQGFQGRLMTCSILRLKRCPTTSNHAGLLSVPSHYGRTILVASAWGGRAPGLVGLAPSRRSASLSVSGPVELSFQRPGCTMTSAEPLSTSGVSLSVYSRSRVSAPPGRRGARHCCARSCAWRVAGAHLAIR